MTIGDGRFALKLGLVLMAAGALKDICRSFFRIAWEGYVRKLSAARRAYIPPSSSPG